MRDNRGPWYLITGLILGVIIGIAYGWGVQPVEYRDTPPGSMRSDFQDHWRVQIALAYQASQDLPRAQARLALLGSPNPAGELTAQAQRWLERNPDEARALSSLAAALGASQPASSGTPAEPSATTPADGTLQSSNPSTARTATPPSAASPVFTPLATRTPTATPGAAYELLTQELRCQAAGQAPRLEVIALDAAGEPVPGVTALVEAPGLQAQFVTGLKPELGLGYADYEIEPEITYSLRLADGGLIIPGLAAVTCQTADGAQAWGAWRFTFQQP